MLFIVKPVYKLNFCDWKVEAVESFKSMTDKKILAGMFTKPIAFLIFQRK